jgi:hypothetical protein
MLSRLNIGASRQHLQWGRASDRSGIERPAPCDKARHDASLTSVASRVTHNCFVRRSARTSARRHCLSNCNCLSNRTRFSIRTSHPSTCHAPCNKMQQTRCSLFVLSPISAARKGTCMGTRVAPAGKRTAEARAKNIAMPASIQTAQFGHGWSCNGRNQAIKGRG